jgi:hypothetical protein
MTFSRTGAVYIAENAQRDVRKVGWTNAPRRRDADLRRAYGFKIKWLGLTDSCRQLEQRIHVVLDGRAGTRVKVNPPCSEFYTLTIDELAQVARDVAAINGAALVSWADDFLLADGAPVPAEPRIHLHPRARRWPTIKQFLSTYARQKQVPIPELRPSCRGNFWAFRWPINKEIRNGDQLGRR